MLEEKLGTDKWSIVPSDYKEHLREALQIQLATSTAYTGKDIIIALKTFLTEIIPNNGVPLKNLWLLILER